jgi:hypothetical protein
VSVSRGLLVSQSLKLSNVAGLLRSTRTLLKLEVRLTADITVAVSPSSSLSMMPPPAEKSPTIGHSPSA